MTSSSLKKNKMWQRAKKRHAVSIARPTSYREPLTCIPLSQKNEKRIAIPPTLRSRSRLSLSQGFKHRIVVAGGDIGESKEKSPNAGVGGPGVDQSLEGFNHVGRRFYTREAAASGIRASGETGKKYRRRVYLVPQHGNTCGWFIPPRTQ